MTDRDEKTQAMIEARERMRDPRHYDRNRDRDAVSGSRFLILLSVLGTTLSAAAMMIFGLIVVAKTIWNTFKDGNFDIEGAKHLAVDLIELTDLFLLGMVLYVVAIGMYQLFINADISIPDWMRVESLNDLKTQLINVIVVLLAVSFLAIAVNWEGATSIVYLGASVCAVIVALAIYNLAHHWVSRDDD
ncbi:MAG TPA: YqhA family protein [Thermomicrobiales bacterium]|nr:YqhA family protein [Thermomicrobiales bacterium]